MQTQDHKGGKMNGRFGFVTRTPEQWAAFVETHTARCVDLTEEYKRKQLRAKSDPDRDAFESAYTYHERCEYRRQWAKYRAWLFVALGLWVLLIVLGLCV